MTGFTSPISAPWSTLAWLIPVNSPGWGLFYTWSLMVERWVLRQIWHTDVCYVSMLYCIYQVWYIYTLAVLHYLMVGVDIRMGVLLTAIPHMDCRIVPGNLIYTDALPLMYCHWVNSYVSLLSFTGGTIWSFKTILLNTVSENARSVLNFVCLVVKQYLYVKRCAKMLPDIHELRTKIRSLEKIEKYIAIKNNKLAKHCKKWEINVQAQ